MSMQPSNTVLIVVDVQNGFTPGGNLAVDRADEIIPSINKLAESFDNVVLTQDWHPDDHVSFASNHGLPEYSTINLAYGQQVLWPKHCVQGTQDAEFHPLLNIPKAQLIIRKGFHADIDSYSAFTEADRKTTTGLEAYLKARGIDTVYVVGIATDFCVAWTAMDAVDAGFKTYIVEDATAAINLNGSLAQAWQKMEALGVQRTQTKQI